MAHMAGGSPPCGGPEPPLPGLVGDRSCLEPCVSGHEERRHGAHQLRSQQSLEQHGQQRWRLEEVHSVTSPVTGDAHDGMMSRPLDMVAQGQDASASHSRMPQQAGGKRKLRGGSEAAGFLTGEVGGENARNKRHRTKRSPRTAAYSPLPSQELPRLTLSIPVAVASTASAASASAAGASEMTPVESAWLESAPTAEASEAAPGQTAVPTAAVGLDETGEDEGSIFASLDDGILGRILSLLPCFFQLSSVSLVCRRWRRVAATPTLQTTMVPSPFLPSTAPWGSLKLKDFLSLLSRMGPHLQAVAYHGQAYLTGDQLLASLTQLPRLVDLKVSGCPGITSADIVQAVPFLNRELKSIDLHCDHALAPASCRQCIMGPPPLLHDAFVVSLANRCTGLRSLDLDTCSAISPAGVACLTSSCPLLQQVRLHSHRLGWPTVRHILQTCAHLQELSVVSKLLAGAAEESEQGQEEREGGRGMEREELAGSPRPFKRRRLLAYSQSQSQSQSQSDSWPQRGPSPLGSGPPSISSSPANATPAPSAGAFTPSPFTSSSSSPYSPWPPHTPATWTPLATISVTGSSVTSASVTPVTPSLDTTPPVTRGSVTTQHRGKMLMRDLEEGGSLLPRNLVSLRLCSAPHVSVAWESGVPLQYLRQLGCQLRALHVQGSFNATWQTVGVWCQRLKVLDLAHPRQALLQYSELEEVVLCGVLRMLPELTHLSLPGGTDRVLHQIARSCPSIEELRLQGYSPVTGPVPCINGVTDFGVGVLLERCTGLRVLNLSGCRQLSSLFLRKLAFHRKAGQPGEPRLRALFLEGCRRIDDSGLIPALPALLETLEVLDMVGCSVTEASLAAILAHLGGQAQGQGRRQGQGLGQRQGQGTGREQGLGGQEKSALSHNHGQRQGHAVGGGPTLFNGRGSADTGCVKGRRSSKAKEECSISMGGGGVKAPVEEDQGAQSSAVERVTAPLRVLGVSSKLVQGGSQVIRDLRSLPWLSVRKGSCGLVWDGFIHSPQY